MIENNDAILDMLVTLYQDLEAILMQGLSAVTDDHISLLKSHSEYIKQAGALNLAENIDSIVKSLSGNDLQSVPIIFKTLVFLRTFERIKTIEYAKEIIGNIAG